MYKRQREAKEETGIEHLRLIGGGVVSLEILPVWAHVKRGRAVGSHLHLNVSYLFEADDTLPPVSYTHLILRVVVFAGGVISVSTVQVLYVALFIIALAVLRIRHSNPILVMVCCGAVSLAAKLILG